MPSIRDSRFSASANKVVKSGRSALVQHLPIADQRACRRQQFLADVGQPDSPKALAVVVRGGQGDPSAAPGAACFGSISSSEASSDSSLWSAF